ncbi:hypothetical protein [Spirosoma jeollabukense]
MNNVNGQQTTETDNEWVYVDRPVSPADNAGELLYVFLLLTQFSTNINTLNRNTMNTLLQPRLAITVLMLIAASLTIQAQSKNNPPVARDGFWVIETTPKSHQCTVRFYTNEQKLIYQETINRSLNINRKQTKLQLNVALEQAMFVWNATHKVPTDRQWVAVQFER